MGVNFQSAEGKENADVPEDDCSKRGQFGWTTIIGVMRLHKGSVILCDKHIPYLKKKGEKYVSVNIVTREVLKFYLDRFQLAVLSCVNIKSYVLTEAETKILNEIKEIHCCGMFGTENNSDYLVKLEDFENFFNFMSSCYKKLTSPTCSSVEDRCGFIRISGDSVVPYTVKEGRKYVPIFYFEGETENLKLKAETLDGWDLSYLKFCCKVQGIKNELFSHDTCEVTSLNDIRSYFPGDTTFEDYWPSKISESQFVRTDDVNLDNTPVWTSAPSVENPYQSNNANKPTMNHSSTTNGVPVYPNSWQVAASGSQTVNSQNYNMTSISSNKSINQLSNQMRAVPHSTSQMANGGVPTMQNTFAGQPIRPQPNPQYYSVTPQNPAPSSMLQNNMVGNRQHNQPTHNSYQNHHMQDQSLLNTLPVGKIPTPPHLQYLQQPIAQKPRIPMMNMNMNMVNGNSSPNSARYIPALNPINNGTGGLQRQRSNDSSSMGGGEVIDLSSPPQSPLISMTMENNLGFNEMPFNRRVSIPSDLVPIPESQNVAHGNLAFKVQKAKFEDNYVPALNAKAYVYDDLLITVQDLCKYFFPHVPLQTMLNVLANVIKVTLFRGNKHQMIALKNAGKCDTLDDFVPLVNLNEMSRIFNVLKYTFKNASDTESAGRQLKRQKVS